MTGRREITWREPDSGWWSKRILWRANLSILHRLLWWLNHSYVVRVFLKYLYSLGPLINDKCSAMYNNWYFISTPVLSILLNTHCFCFFVFFAFSCHFLHFLVLYNFKNHFVLENIKLSVIFLLDTCTTIHTIGKKKIRQMQCSSHMKKKPNY